MRRHPFHTLLQAAKALVSLHTCTDSPEPLFLDDASHVPAHMEVY